MSEQKSYFYMRVKDSFYDRDELKLLQSMPDGYIYSDILMKMYLKSLKEQGRLTYKGMIPYSPEMLATITGHQVGTVREALRIFEQLGLIELLDNGTIYMLDIQAYIGHSSSEADRQREYQHRIRQEQRALLLEGEKESCEEPCKESNGLSCNDSCNDSCYGSGKIHTPYIEDKSYINESIIQESKQNTKQDFCAELQSNSAPPVISLPLNNGSEYPISPDAVNNWLELYPAVDIYQELKKMKGWLEANPKNRKTKSGILRFVNGWLSKEQDRSRPATVRTAAPPANPFYDYVITGGPDND